jgi:hypothetical protein
MLGPRLLARLASLDGTRADLWMHDQRAMVTITIAKVGDVPSKGVVIGEGPTRLTALHNAIDCLQASIDAVDVAIAREPKPGDVAKFFTS